MEHSCISGDSFFAMLEKPVSEGSNRKVSMYDGGRRQRNGTGKKGRKGGAGEQECKGSSKRM